MGSYVTHIATKLHIDLQDLEHEDKPKSIDRDRLRNWGWMTSTWSDDEERWVHTWITQRHGDYLMPIQCPPISYTDPATWLLQLPHEPDHMDFEQQQPPQAPQPPAHQHHQPPHHGFGHFAAPQVPFYIPQQEWTTAFQAIQDMQQTQIAHGRLIRNIRKTQLEQARQIDDISEYLYQFHMRGYEADSDAASDPTAGMDDLTDGGDDDAAGGGDAGDDDDG
jgi:hypothetical protein